MDTMRKMNKEKYCCSQRDTVQSLEQTDSWNKKETQTAALVQCPVAVSGSQGTAAQMTRETVVTGLLVDVVTGLSVEVAAGLSVEVPVSEVTVAVGLVAAGSLRSL